MPSDDTPIELERFLPYRLSRLAAETSRQMQTIYKAEHGLTIPEWRTLATIGQFGTVTARAIGAHASMHKTKVSRAVAALEQRRWVTRARNPDDRREDFLTLTGLGLKTYRRLAPKLRAFEAGIGDRFARHAGGATAADLDAALAALEQALGITAPSRKDL